ncbi:Nascent polypeptide-associated complex protein [uncultured archaeon]|nr:Nascent polypeptide-associated complex protein [uncultured archaeon]
MFPGLGGVNPKQMNALMKQMGISQTEIETDKVVIHKADGKKIVIEPAHVLKIKMQGQDSFQITGEEREEAGELFSEEDIKTVMEKAGVKKDAAKKALEKSKGDLAEAILELS